MDASSVFFVSDAHLGVDPADREAARTARLHDFLNSLVGRAASLYIVGDLFDFWFEYRTAIPRRHFPTLVALRKLVESGVPVTMMNGNHDFWLGHFHHAYERREPGREFFVLGDWIDRFTYGELTGGRLELRTWPPPARAK